jgi:transposase InsO family protein
MFDCLWLLIDLIRAARRRRGEVLAENLLLRHQLLVVGRPTRTRPRLAAHDKLVWLVARRLLRDGHRHLVLVRPETVVRRHARAWRLWWRWRSRSPLGRPRVSVEVRGRIATMARDNPSWGAERVRGELLKLGIVVSRRSVQRYRQRVPPCPLTQRRRTFPANHGPQAWAADLLTVQTLTFRTLSVRVLADHARREIVHRNVSASPTAAWVWRQLIAATPWGRTPRGLVRDRDAAYGRDFVRRARGLGIETLLTPIRAPRANAVAERLIGTLRRECLDHVVIVDEAHLRSVLTEFGRYDNLARPHRSLDLDTPIQRVRAATGPIRASPVLAGLHQTYERAA